MLQNEDRVEGGRTDRELAVKIAAATQKYPLKKRALTVLSTGILLLVVTINWKFGPTKWIAICLVLVAYLFEPKGRGNMFFLGMGIGVALSHLLE
jgi:hypothetical protein